MKNNFSLICILILCIGLFSIQNSTAEEIKYYKSYSLNKIDFSIEPKEELSQKEALELVCNAFTYDSEGRLIKIEGSAFGLKYSDTYFEVPEIRFSQEENELVLSFYNKAGEAIKDKLYRAHQLKIYKQKDLCSISFLDANAAPCMTEQGFSRKLNKKIGARTVVQSYFDKEGNEVPNKLGVFRTKIIYDEKKRPLILESQDKYGLIMNNKHYYAIEKYNYTGKQIEISYYNARNKPVEVFPYFYYRKRVNESSTSYFDKNNKEFKLIQNMNSIQDSIIVNYDLVHELSSQDMLSNLMCVETEFMNFGDSNIDDLDNDKYLLDWAERHQKLVNKFRKDKAIHFEHIYGYMSSRDENKTLCKHLDTLNEEQLERAFYKLFLERDSLGNFIYINHLDVFNRVCYGGIKLKEITFFKWKDILFCVNPYFEHNRDHTRNLLTVDFSKLPLDGVKHVFFNGMKVNNYWINKYIDDINFSFLRCSVERKPKGITEYLKAPAQATDLEAFYPFYTNHYFVDCKLDRLDFTLHGDYSQYPRRYFPSYRIFFENSKIESCRLTSNTSRIKDEFSLVHSVYLKNSEFNELEMRGHYDEICIKDCKIFELRANQVYNIYDKLHMHNSAFETPLNFANILMADSSELQIFNTSYEAYMKFPWDEIKGKITCPEGEDELKSLRNIYNLLSSNYKSLALIEDADNCYFYWKQYEKENFWRMYWKQEATNWYNPLHVFRGLGYTLFNKVNYYSCGYGIKPLWILPFTLFIVSFFALIYFLMPTSISSIEEHLISRDKISKKLKDKQIEQLRLEFNEYDFDFNQNKQGLIEDIISSLSSSELMEKLGLKPKSKYNLSFFWYCFYFSFSTFTTIGIGDWYPTGRWNKLLVMIEGALGWLCLGLFITTYANILLR